VLRSQLDWLKEIPFSCLQNALVVDLHQAFQHFYRRAQNGERIQGAAKNPLGYPVPCRKSHLLILWKLNNVSIRSLSKACGGRLLFLHQDAKVSRADENASGPTNSCGGQEWSEAGDSRI